MKTLLLPLVVLLAVNCGRASAQDNKTEGASDKPKEAPAHATEPARSASAEREERFKALMTKATLSGRWAPLKDGELGEEKSGDKYTIVGVTKGESGKWTVNAKMKYKDQEFVLPVPVEMKFAGDTAILIVDKLSIPGGGTYSARVMFFEKTYSGAWSGARGGGMLYGTITNEKE